MVNKKLVLMLIFSVFLINNVSAQFKFAVFADMQASDCTDNSYIVQQINAIASGAADFSVSVGDLIAGYSDASCFASNGSCTIEGRQGSMKYNLQPITSKTPPVGLNSAFFPGIGNHDDGWNSWYPDPCGEGICDLLNPSLYINHGNTLNVPGFWPHNLNHGDICDKTSSATSGHGEDFYYSFSYQDSYFIVLRQNNDYFGMLSCNSKPVQYSSCEEWCSDETLLLNSQRNSGCYNVYQYDWWMSELIAAQNNPAIKHIFVFLHAPLVTSSWNHAPTVGAAQFIDLMEKYSKVRMVLNGHNANYERTYPIRNNVIDNTNGIVYITTGPAGGKTDGINGAWFTASSYQNWTAYNNQQQNSGHVLITVKDNGDILIERYGLTNNLQDGSLWKLGTSPSCDNDLICDIGETCSCSDCANKQNGCSSSQLCCSGSCKNTCFLDSDCNDFNSCTIDSCVNPGLGCISSCSNTPISACINSDGCCPLGCTSVNDNNCIQCTSDKIYVSPTGSDTTGDGNSCNPYQTIQYAANLAVAGDTVHALPGTYILTDSIYLTNSGTSVNRITFEGEQGTIINAAGVPANLNGAGFFVNTANYITIRGFKIINSAYSGIRTSWADYIDIINSSISNSGFIGIFTDYSDYTRIENSTVYDTIGGHHCVYLSNSGDNPIVRGNEFYDCENTCLQNNADPAMIIDPMNPESDGVTTNMLVENNILHNCGLGIGSGFGINLASVRNSIFRNNLLYNIPGGGFAGSSDGGGVNFGSKNNVFVNNIVYHDFGTGRAGIRFVEGSTGNSVLNNVFVMGRNGTPLNYGAIEYSADSSSQGTIDYNAYYRYGNQIIVTEEDANEYTLSQWRTLSGQDAHSFMINDPLTIFTNPLVDNFNYLAGASVIDAGTSSNAPLFDLEYKSRPQLTGYDIGAYEFQGTLPSPPTCQFSTAQWSTTSATEGNVVSLNLQGTDCNGKSISFVVWEDDLIGDDPVITNPVNAVFSGNTATGSWTAEWQDDALTDPEYYFIAILTTNLTETITSTNQLIVSKGAVSSSCPSYALNGNK